IAQINVLVQHIGIHSPFPVYVLYVWILYLMPGGNPFVTPAKRAKLFTKWKVDIHRQMRIGGGRLYKFIPPSLKSERVVRPKRDGRKARISGTGHVVLLNKRGRYHI